MSDFLSVKQRKNLDFFKRELPKLLQSASTKDKYIIIHDECVKGAYDTFENALNEAVAKYPADEFVIQQVLSESASLGFLFNAVRDDCFAKP